MKIDQKFKINFTEKLIAWYRANKRELPWRKTSDPYKIWLSEIMLQQTQVDTVIPYYNQFVRKFPSIRKLAEAKLDEVLKLWEGLGYYARARNFYKAAQEIVFENEGNIPCTHSELIKIQGIGPYTAAAISSIAFGEDHPVLDGNVYRVLARVKAITESPAEAQVKKRFENIAKQLLPEGQSGDYNQAIMELGALICTPQNPKCAGCPVSAYCRAYQTMDDPSVLPVKKAKKALPHYDIAVGIIWKSDKVLIDQRELNGLLGGLWEFPGGKQEPGETLEECVKREIKNKFSVNIKVLEKFAEIKHTYTHFKITLHAFSCKHLSGIPKPQKAVNWKWVLVKDLSKYPLPKSNKRIADKLIETNNGHRHN